MHSVIKIEAKCFYLESQFRHPSESPNFEGLDSCFITALYVTKALRSADVPYRAKRRLLTIYFMSCKNVSNNVDSIT